MRLEEKKATLTHVDVSEERGMLTSWGSEFARARQRLLECADFETQQRVGHQLKEGAVLTSISDVPFEMSFKCALCGVIFWFENVAWRWGGAARWRLIEESRMVQGCVGHGARGVVRN